ncbi:uncharacterized protein LOC143276609 isoform X2 [Babylonia areolata]|uniref:uncharacterized protein LOC143276609 isoform X2 n=1 Tax=Babylonia areolata TaxID=304850 RepID=UPI003FD0D8F4
MLSSSKQWIHSPDQLTKSQITYNVKFLGECAVEQPKGTGVVKDAIRKMKFNRHLKRAEGQKPPKVQLTVCVDGVAIQDPKSKATLHEYPLHRISYCADDKSDKQMFTFIAKAATTNDHYCYVFKCSEKSAQEITLTVGQAFDLAYKRFLEEGSTAAGPGGETDYRKQCLLLQRRLYSLEFENDALKKRVYELEKLKDRSDLEEFMKNNKIKNLTTIMLNLRPDGDDDEPDETSDDFEETADDPRTHQSQVGRRLENLLLDKGSSPAHSDGDTSPSAAHTPSTTPVLSPPPPVTRHHRQVGGGVSSPVHTSASAPPPSTHTTASGDLGANPFSSPTGWPVTSSPDPFGMGAFNPAPSSVPAPTPTPTPQLSSNGSAAFAASSHLELMDIHAGFSRGLSFGTDDFNLDDLDPLSHRL